MGERGRQKNEKICAKTVSDIFDFVILLQFNANSFGATLLK